MLLGGCNYEENLDFDRVSDEVEISPQVVAPLAYGDFTLEDLLLSIDSSGLLEQDQEGLLYLYYTDTIYSINAGEVIQIPNKLTTEAYIESEINIPGWLLSDLGDTVYFTKEEMIDFEIDSGDRLDSILMKSGILNVQVESEFHHTGFLTITSSNVTDPQGDSLVETIPISQDDGNFSTSLDWDLDGYRFEVEEESGTGYIRVYFNLALINSGADVNAGEQCSIEMNFQDLEFSHIYGYIADREVLNESGEVAIDLYDEVADIINVYFYDPQFNLFVHNSYGLPVEIDLANVEAYSESQGVTTPLTFSNDTMNPFVIGAPTVGAIGSTVTTERYINRETSNIDDILATSPNQFTFNVIANTGVPGADPVDQNFVLDTSKMTIEAEVVLPMWLKTDGYTLEDTVDLDLEGALGDLAFIDTARLRMKSYNEWPLSIEVQVYFMDDTYTVIDSMFSGETVILDAAQVDQDGVVVEDLLDSLTVDVGYTGSDLMELDQTRHALIKARAITTSDGTEYVKFYNDYTLEFKFSAFADFTINSRELSSGE